MMAFNSVMIDSADLIIVIMDRAVLNRNWDSVISLGFIIQHNSVLYKHIQDKNPSLLS